MFGYVTATIASYFIDRDADRSDTAVAGAREIEALRAEIAAMREAALRRGHRIVPPNDRA